MPGSAPSAPARAQPIVNRLPNRARGWPPRLRRGRRRHDTLDGLGARRPTPYTSLRRAWPRERCSTLTPDTSPGMLLLHSSYPPYRGWSNWSTGALHCSTLLRSSYLKWSQHTLDKATESTGSYFY